MRENSIYKKYRIKSYIETNFRLHAFRFVYFYCCSHYLISVERINYAIDRRDSAERAVRNNFILRVPHARAKLVSEFHIRTERIRL